MEQSALVHEPVQEKAARHAMNVPKYVDVGGGRVLAQFSGTVESPDSLEIERSRARSYPGLLASAPRTDAIYRSFAAFAQGRTVLDIGCGSGTGISYLTGATNICAIDVDEVAVWFTKNTLPGVSAFRLDACKDALPRAEVVILVDVLGHVVQPRDVLRKVAAAVGEGGMLCIAEPHASIAQELSYPVRRAFSKPQFEALLLDAGFIVNSWLSDTGFLSVVATHQASAWTLGIGAVDELRAEGLESEALDLLASPPNEDDAGVAPAWYLRIAEICLARADGDGALEALLEIQSKAPDDARVLATLARLTLGMGAVEDAARFAIAAAQRDPANSVVAFALAQAVGHKLTAAEDIALWSNAGRLDPTDVDVAVALARTAARHDAFHLGIKALERVREYHPTLPADFHLTLGWMYLMSGRVEDALMECRLATIVEADNAAIAELLAAICEVGPRPIGVS